MKPSQRFEVFAGCLILAVLGAAYAGFNVVGGLVSQRLRFSSMETAVTANAGILGSWLHVDNGIYVAKYGPRAAIRVGMILSIFGFGGMTLLFLHILPPFAESPYAVALFNFLAMHGASFSTMAALAALPPLFNAQDRPSIMGALGATFALGQALISSLYAVVLRHFDLAAHFGVLACLSFLIQLYGYQFFPRSNMMTPVRDDHTGDECSDNVSEQPPPQALSSAERCARNAIYRAIIAISVLLCTGHSFQLWFDGLYVRVFGLLTWTVSMTGFLFLHRFKIIPIFAKNDRIEADDVEDLNGSPLNRRSVHLPAAQQQIQTPLTFIPTGGSSLYGAPESCRNDLLRSEEFSGLDLVPNVNRRHSMCASRDREKDVSCSSSSTMQPWIPAYFFQTNFWLLFISYFCCAGLASALNSIASLIIMSVEPESKVAQGEALPASPASALLMSGQIYSLAALGRCWGGLAFGVFSQHRMFANSKCTLCMFCHQFSFVTLLLLLLTLSVPGLYISLPLVNFAWGLLYSSSQIVAVELFGHEYFCSLWGGLSTSPCLSTFIFAVGIAGELADKVREYSYYTVNEFRVCRGTICFAGSLSIFCGISALGVYCISCIVWRRRNEALSYK